VDFDYIIHKIPVLLTDFVERYAIIMLRESEYSIRESIGID